MGWFGFDLDGTLAVYKKFESPTHIGDPIPATVALVKKHLAKGHDCRIFTARVKSGGNISESEVAAVKKAIGDWTEKHIGKRLAITCYKDYGMIALYDDRCCQVEQNTGKILGEDLWS